MMTFPYTGEQGFQTLVRHIPSLASPMTAAPGGAFAECIGRIEQLYSSYKQNGYHYLLYSLVRSLMPERCVELGVLEGFSLMTMGLALKENQKGSIHGYDLFEQYPYRHARFADVAALAGELQLSGYVSVFQKDAMSAVRNYDAVDLLHVDISNNGSTYRDVFKMWADSVGTAIILEGGGPERDSIDWMIKYNKPSIVQALAHIKEHYTSWKVITLNAYPSMTIALKKDRFNEP